ncbi:MAG TPA: hypothetical protein VIH37_03860 [Candidatus Limnocylindrales bacterium]
MAEPSAEPGSNRAGGERPAPDRPAAPRQPGLREVLVVAAIVVAVVLLADAVTTLLPSDLRDFVVHTPLLIVVLVLGTAIVLWRILRAPSA